MPRSEHQFIRIISIKKNIGLTEITNVRIGKHITLEVEANSEEEASEKVDKACSKMLCNQIMEGYNFKFIASKALTP